MSAENREQLLREPRPIFPEVFQAYITANLLWPQTDVGLTILPLATYLQETDSIEGFFEAELSVNQQQEIARVMNSAHHAVSVDVSSDGLGIDMGTGVKNSSLQSIPSLWRQVKAFDLTTVATYADYAITGRLRSMSVSNVKTLVTFIHSLEMLITRLMAI